MVYLDSSITEFSDEDIAKSREIASQGISEMNVYWSVVENIVNMDAEISTKIDILLQAVPDLGIILAHLSKCRSKAIITNNYYSKLVKSCLLWVNKNGGSTQFNPTHLGHPIEGAE